ESSDVIFIAVGTPPDEDGSADLTHVLDVARTIGRHMNRSKLVVTKSTVPVGTAQKVRASIAAETTTPFQVCANPEFLKEGAAVEDFMKPDRVIVGVDSPEAAQVIGELYAPFVRTGNPIIFMDLASAEMTKYAANAHQKRVLYEKRARHFGGKLRSVTVGVWGLAFKAETDDVRESPALVLVEQLLEAGARVRVHDPAAMDTARHQLGDRVTYAG